ncbi:protein kinase domain-containing protein [Dactylosporangium sp. CA-052675]|uniref:protein kinase domain-containing protein n=1 Tax=Dactylosporangium sp. CA-052675 TaxID=3239927 RepID=UPI003D916060
MAGRLLNGRYELRSVIGRGGMADVWLAVDGRLDRPVAVKILHGDGGADPSLPERFEREAHTAARLSHPSIVAVYDFGVDDGTPYLVMELVQGHSLADELAAGPLDPRRAAHIAERVCDALEAAHNAGVVHRDVKPANILISQEDEVKVCDFGIASITDRAQTALTAPATVIGTSSYMAPEQVLGEPVDARTDLYALGCVLYTMLTGRPPFIADSPVQTAWQQVHEAPVPVAVLRPGLPPCLADLVGALLAKRPTDRPGSAAQVGAVLAGAATTAFDPGPAPFRGRAPVRPATLSLPVLAEPPAPTARRRRGRSVGIALAALGAVAAAVFALGTLPGRSDHHPAAAPTPAETTQSQPSADPSSAAPSDTPTDEPSPTPSDTPSNTPSDTPSPTPSDTTEATLAAVRAAVRDGGLDFLTTRDLNRRLDRFARDHARGDDEGAAAELDGLVGRLDQLHQNGTLASTDYTAIRDLADQLAADLPPRSG